MIYSKDCEVVVTIAKNLVFYEELRFSSGGTLTKANKLQLKNYWQLVAPEVLTKWKS